MRTTLALAAVIWISSFQIALAEDDPFAPAKAGKLECFAPDTEKKTCFAMTRYEWDGSGNVLAEEESIISSNPLITVKSRDPVVIKGSEACATNTEKSFQNVAFLKEGFPVPEDEQDKLLQEYSLKYRQFVGRNLCIDISPYEGVFIVQFSIDGNPLPSATNRMTWIGPDEGYVLAP